MLEEILFNHSSEIGLLLFVMVFVGTTLWAITRTRNQVDHWSSLPLGGSDSAGRSEME